MAENPTGLGRSVSLGTSVNLKRFDLLSLHLVLQCAKHGSISAAASRCHLSVMGASDRLRRLEHTLGRPLFWRHRHGLEPTHAGVAAINAARTVVEAVSDMLEKVGSAAPEAPRLPVNPGRPRKRRSAPVEPCLPLEGSPAR